MGDRVNTAISDMRLAGFQGDKILMAGHSLGGVMAQNYAKTNTDTIKGLVMMGATIERSNYNVN